MKMWNRKSGYLFVGEVPLLYVLLNIYLHIIYICIILFFLSLLLLLVFLSTVPLRLSLGVSQVPNMQRILVIKQPVQ